MNLIIVSGLSGSGKTIALHALEDLGFYCIDNLPIGLLPSLATEILEHRDDEPPRFAVGIDARNLAGDLADFPALMEQLEARGVRSEIIFLQAEENELLKRFSETRRRHPLSSGDLPLREALHKERQLLDPVISAASLVIDTTHTNVHQLRDQLAMRLRPQRDGGMSVQFLSFGFKHGAPADADFIFDLRCLPNPHWVAELRSQTGRDAAVAEFLAGHPSVEEMFVQIRDFLATWLPAFEADNRSYITIALGCTGGQHRSVYFAERLRAFFAKKYDNVLLRHRELT